jgi:hypothetical protein
MERAALILVLLAATPAASADMSAAGAWRVSGAVSGFKFELRCVFQQAGERLSGACTDLATNNPKAPPKSAPHLLTRGSASGGQVTWSYQSSFLLSKFDVDFSGAQSGDRMAGAIQSGGRTGSFTARRE